MIIFQTIVTKIGDTPVTKISDTAVTKIGETTSLFYLLTLQTNIT